MACNSNRCHCPDCEAEKREQTQNLRLTSVEHRVGALEIAARPRTHPGIHPDDRCRVDGSRVIHRGSRGKTYKGYGDDPYLIWCWRPDDCNRYWRKWDVRERKFFGAPWTPRQWTPLPGKQDEFFSTPPAHRWARGGLIAGPVGHGDRADFTKFSTSVELRRNPTTEEMEYAMTPIMLEIMLHASYVCASCPRWRAPAYDDAVMRLKALGLIEDTTLVEQHEHMGWIIKATAKGKVYVKGVLTTPMPVKSEPEWKMP